MGRAINIDVETDPIVAIGMCSRTGVGKTRHIQVRWSWIQDAIRDRVVRLRKVKGTTTKPTWNQAFRRTDTSVWLHQAAAHRLIVRKPLREAAMRSGRLSIAIAGGNGEVRRPMNPPSRCTWFGWKMLRSTRTSNVDVSRRGAGRTCLMFVVTRVVKRVHSNGQDRKRISAHRLHVVTR